MSKPVDVNILGIIIKSTRNCNLRCSYCHDWRSKKRSMHFNVLANLTAKALTPSYFGRVEFIWHGGEPLLLGKDYYLKALCLQKEFRQKKQFIRNSIQTNGTLIDDGWCELFKNYGFHVGVSIDGPELLHNSSRKYASGKGSYDDVRYGIRLLEKHKIRHGVLMVITHKTLKLGPEKIFNFFVKDLKVKSFALLPARPDNTATSGEVVTSEYITPQEYCSFMKRIFDLWYEMDDPTISIRELTSIINVLVGGSSTTCSMSGHCLGEYFAIDPNGDVFYCDKFLGDGDYKIGNINQHNFKEICSSKKIYSINSKQKKILHFYNDCSCFEICKGGCPHDVYLAMKYLKGHREKCCGLRVLIEHIYKRIVKDTYSFKTDNGKNIDHIRERGQITSTDKEKTGLQ